MAGEGQPAIERLRAYLRDLKPGARALLISELERGVAARRQVRPAPRWCWPSCVAVFATAAPSRCASATRPACSSSRSSRSWSTTRPTTSTAAASRASDARADLAVAQQHADAGGGAGPIPSRSSRRCCRRHRQGRAAGARVPGPRGPPHPAVAGDVRQGRQGAPPPDRAARHARARSRTCRRCAAF